MRVLLIGPPASGKGTIGARLSQRLGLPLISIGSLLRDLSPAHPSYEKIAGAMKEGRLVPNNLVAEILATRLHAGDCVDGFILDGWGRLFDDIQKLDPSPDKVIFLNVDIGTAIKRISGRRICEKDDTLYNIFTNPPKNESLCDVCGGKLTQRADDTEEGAIRRYESFMISSMETVDFYRAKGILAELDAGGSADEVFSAAMEVFGSAAL